MTKQKQRAELERLCAEYDGPISKGVGQRVVIACTACRHRRTVAVAFALSFGRACNKCGAKTRIES